MSASRASRASLTSASRASSRPRCPPYLHHRPRPTTQSAAFHSTPCRQAKHKSPYRSITQAELKRIADARAALFPKYTQSEREKVRQTYVPEQQQAIDYGEEAVDPWDLARAKPRRDVLRPKTIDPNAYSRLQPIIDHRASTTRGQWDNYNDNQPTAHLDFIPDDEKKLDRLGEIITDPKDIYFNEPREPGEEDPGIEVTDRSMFEELADQDDWKRQQDAAKREGQNWSAEAEGGENELLRRMLRDVSGDGPVDRTQSRLSTAERLENALRWRSHADPPELSQEIPKIHDPRWMYTEDSAAAAEDDEGKGVLTKGQDDEGANAWNNLARIMGRSVQELQRYRFKLLVQKRVVNQTRLGKISSQSLLYVCGDERGMVGIGEGKASEVGAADRMARINAIRDMKPIRRYEKRTIYGEVVGKVGAVELKLNARPPGFGLRCSSYAYEIAKCAGLQDLQAKSLRSRNPMNVCKAMVEALRSQKDPEDIARARGKKMVDVRKVYYAGLLS
ncbi:MAG: hypothetical protein Q9162_001399 [Coniocarpon cinnabarinum]